MKNHIELVEVMGRLDPGPWYNPTALQWRQAKFGVFPGKGVGKPGGKGGKGSSPITLIKIVVNHP